MDRLRDLRWRSQVNRVYSFFSLSLALSLCEKENGARDLL